MRGESTRPTRSRVIMISAVVVALVAGTITTYYEGYGTGFSAGYMKGQVHGQIEQLIQAGSTLTLAPGGNLTIPLTLLDFAGEVQNLTITVPLFYEVLCTQSPPSPYPCPHASFELYIVKGSALVANTTYRGRGLVGGNLSFDMRTTDTKLHLYPTYIVLKANASNVGDVVISWRAPLVLVIKPTLSGPPFP